MSLPYPYRRARARQAQGEQPYKDAREVMGEKEARLQARAEERGRSASEEGEEERVAHLKGGAAGRLAEVGAEKERPGQV